MKSRKLKSTAAFKPLPRAEMFLINCYIPRRLKPKLRMLQAKTGATITAIVGDAVERRLRRV